MSSRRPATRKLASRSTTAQTTASQLADQLAATLSLSDAKGKRKANTQLSQEEQKRQAMKMINSASQSLSTIVQSEWRRSQEKLHQKSSVLKEANEAAANAAKHLSILRNITPGCIDIERAGMSILGKLVALEMYEAALPALQLSHPCICALLGQEITNESSSDPLRLISLPLPSLELTNTIVLTLVSTYLVNAVSILSQTYLSHSPRTDNASRDKTFREFSDALTNRPTLLSWIGLCSSLPSKHNDSILTRTYSVLTKLASTAKTVHPEHLFSLRLYAIRCLAHCSAGTLEKPDSFWDQVNKVTAAYIKSPGITEQESAGRLMSSFVGLVVLCEGRTDAKTFMSGRGFMAFCECWIALAHRIGDIQSLDKIAVLMHNSSSSSCSSPTSKLPVNHDDEGTSPSIPIEGVIDKKDLVVRGTALYGTLAQVTTILDQPMETSVLTRLQEATITLKKSPALTFLSNSFSDKNLQRVAGKVDRALERVRRGAVKALDASQRPPDTLRIALGELLEVIISIYEAAIRVDPIPDFLTQVLDVLFVLSRTGLLVADPRTYTPSYDYLERALSILCIEDSDAVTIESHTTIPDLDNYVRCVSGAFYNIAGTLYQAGRFGSAIPFLKQGCRLGVVALDLHGRTSAEDGTKEIQEGDSKRVAWKQLEEQLWRRWQLLGVCYMKIGDRRPAFDSLLKCVKAFPYTANDFGLQAAKSGFKGLFELSPAVKELASIIERISYLGACELLLPSEAITLHSVGLEDYSVVGALLEKQIDSLENSWWKQGVCDTTVGLMKDAIEVYRGGDMPIRASRVFLRLLALAYHLGPDRVVTLGSPEELGAEANKLLSSTELGRDASLASYCYEYQASIHLWLGLHAHRRSDSKQSVLISEHADEACRILRSFIMLSKGESKPARRSLPKQSPTRKKAETKKASAASRTTRAKPRSKIPVTPKPKPRPVLQDISTNASSPTVARAVTKNGLPTLDNVSDLLEVLQLTSHVLGLLALVLPKIQVLSLSRRISEQFAGSTTDGYIVSSSELAYEYFKLGKTRRACRLFEQVLVAARSGQVSEDAACYLLLRYSASCAMNADVAQSIKLYSEGRVLARGLTEDKHGSTMQRLQARVARIERVAIAHQVLGSILSTQNDGSAFVNNLLQSFRLWSRAFESLARLHPETPKTPKSSPDESNPFEVSSLRDALPANTPTQTQSEQPRKSFARRHSMNGLEWRISQGLLDTLFSLVRVYAKRGSPREAQYFAQQARDLAEALNAPAHICRAARQNGELQLHQGKLEEGYTEVLNMDCLLNDSAGADMADMYRLRGDFEQRGAKVDGAQHHYEAAARILEAFDQTFVTQDGIDGPRKSVGNEQFADVLLPELLAQVLARRIWLLRNETGENFVQLLNRFMMLPSTPSIQVAKEGLAAKLAFDDVYKRSRVDMFLSSIGETTVALPMGASTDLSTSMSPASLEMMKSLENAENLFWTHLASLGFNGSAPDIRESALTIAVIRAFQASMGRCVPSGPSLLAGLLDASSALTLRSEILEAIDNKFRPSPIQDELQWPSLSPSDSPRPVARRLQRSPFIDSDDDDDDLEDNLHDIQESALRQYWASVKQRFEAQALNPEILTSSSMSELPSNWTVVHITVTEDKNTMFISRQRGGTLGKQHPLIFCVPLKGRREGPEDEDNEHLTFEDALSEMDEIIQLSNATTKVAASIRNDREARAKWWKERGALDTRIRELLENIEFCWLGAFKTILSKNPRLSPEAINNLRIQFDRVFKTGLRLQDKKTKERAIGHSKAPSESWTPNRVTLDDALIECFSTLSPQCRDEELEDLVYFILDLYQFHGVPVAIAEVDVDQVVIDLRTVLEEHWSKTKTGNRTGHGHAKAFGYSGGENDDEHLFLVLDKNVQGLPWESIPMLRGRSVSRIPGISFLLDRVRFARLKQRKVGAGIRTVDRACVDPRKGYYIMNPSGDLDRTESRFRTWLDEMEQVGWHGVSGRAPSELEVLHALQTKDLVVYFGHGGGEQYVRSHKIRNLPQCAAVMLWGCSSGALREMGDFDRVGTPWNYMLSGCPTLVANLWDVTDKDIDIFSQAVFDKLHLNAESVRGWHPSVFAEASTSLVNAVAESRDSCKLKYLTGAAPVVYGIPFYL